MKLINHKRPSSHIWVVELKIDYINVGQDDQESMGHYWIPAPNDFQGGALTRRTRQQAREALTKISQLSSVKRSDLRIRRYVRDE